MTALRRRSFPASPGGGGGAAAPEGGRRAAAAARPASARDSPLYPLCYAGRAPQRPATSPTTPGMAASRRCFSLASPGGGGGAAAPEGGRSVRRHNTPRLRARFPPRPLCPLCSGAAPEWPLRVGAFPLPPPAGEVGPQPRKGARPRNGCLAQTLFPLASPSGGGGAAAPKGGRRAAVTARPAPARDFSLCQPCCARRARCACPHPPLCPATSPPHPAASPPSHRHLPPRPQRKTIPGHPPGDRSCSDVQTFVQTFVQTLPLLPESLAVASRLPSKLRCSAARRRRRLSARRTSSSISAGKDSPAGSQR